jgi:hypothetical protein
VLPAQAPSPVVRSISYLLFVLIRHEIILFNSEPQLTNHKFSSDKSNFPYAIALLLIAPVTAGVTATRDAINNALLRQEALSPLLMFIRVHLRRFMADLFLRDCK